MSEINFLPWREEAKARRLKNLVVAAVGLWIVAGLIVFGAYNYFEDLKRNHNARNSFLRAEIQSLDEEIKEIDQLRQQRDKLISRMQVIQNLQSDRTELVNILSDMVRNVPEGVYLTKLQLQESKVTLSGRAESNGRVSSFMRALEDSSWYHNPTLKIIRAVGGDAPSEFSLQIAKAGSVKKPDS
jgi:type IV pilus assembly protein PilN